ncbi:uncharacterized protein METZ01_LOCUS2673 [marine metagenome]|uniref:Uncharacterized protein n=1 Tax=marine metagenome TaxID=408172 RepID=A0A381N5T7_9ZZZZ
MALLGRLKGTENLAGHRWILRPLDHRAIGP